MKSDRTRIQDAKSRLLGRIEVQIDGCWNWLGFVHPTTGYGAFHLTLSNWASGLVHRVSYRIFVGCIPEGLHIDHLCRNRRCANPHHMRLVTPKQNVLCGIGISAQNAVKTECAHGHAFSEENTYFYPDGPHAGERVCRMCGKLRMRKYRAEKRAIAG